MIPANAEVHPSLQGSAFTVAHLRMGNNVIAHAFLQNEVSLFIEVSFMQEFLHSLPIGTVRTTYLVTQNSLLSFVLISSCGFAAAQCGKPPAFRPAPPHLLRLSLRKNRNSPERQSLSVLCCGPAAADTNSLAENLSSMVGEKRVTRLSYFLW